MVQELKEKIITLENFKSDYEKTLIMQDSYNKRLNILIYGIKEDVANAREPRDATSEKFRNFVRDGLKIEDPMMSKLSTFIAYLNTQSDDKVQECTVRSL